MVQREKFFKRL